MLLRQHHDINVLYQMLHSRKCKTAWLEEMVEEKQEMVAGSAACLGPQCCFQVPLVP